MTTGRSFGRKIDEAIAKLNQEHDGQSRQLDALNQEITLLQRTAAQAARAIAREHIAALDAREIQAYDQITEEAIFRINGRQEDLRKLRTALARNLNVESLALQAQDAAALVRDQASAGLREFEETCDAELATDQAYVALMESASRANTVAEAASEKAKVAVEESASKASAYEADPIFQYLHKRRYGTTEYRRKVPHPVRVVDGWVARLCGYPTAAYDYGVLTTMPAYLGGHADDMRKKADEAASKAISYRSDKLNAAGGAKLRAALRQANQSLTKMDEQLDNARHQLQKTRDDLHLVEEWRDDLSSNLLSRMSDIFTREGFDKLRSRVLATASLEDDTNLAKIEQSVTAIKDKQARAAEIEAYIQSIADRMTSLAGLKRQYRQKGYESSDYRVSGSGADDLLTGFLLGKVAGSDLWRGISTSVRYDPPYKPSTSSSTSSFGSLSGGSFKTGGGFGGGRSGFKTGGGF